MMMKSRGELPAWVDVGLIPLLNLAVALLFSGLVVLIIGENPLQAMWIMLKGAVGSLRGWGYLLYYATNFVFKTIETEARVSQRHWQETGRVLFQDILAAEQADGRRIVLEN